MYIAQTFNVLHEWWRYAIGFVLVFIAVIIGQLPFTVVVMAKALGDGESLQTLDEQTMLTILEPNLNGVSQSSNPILLSYKSPVRWSSDGLNKNKI